MKAVVGADDGGPVLEAALEYLRSNGWEVDVMARDRWPQIARKVGQSVAAGDCDFGLLMCWTGTGTSMMANKVSGVRAALCWEPWIAEGARRWNDANLLVMSLKRTTPEDAVEILKAWLAVNSPDADEQANIEALKAFDEAR